MPHPRNAGRAIDVDFAGSRTIQVVIAASVQAPAGVVAGQIPAESSLARDRVDTNARPRQATKLLQAFAMHETTASVMSAFMRDVSGHAQRAPVFLTQAFLVQASQR